MELCEVIVGSYEEITLGYRLSKSDEVYRFEASFTDHSHISSVRCAEVSNKNVLATGSADEHIKLLNLRTRKEMGSLLQHEGTITDLCFWGKRHLISCGEDGAICLFDTKTWEPLRTFRGHKNAVNSVCVHPSGKVMMSVSRDKHLRTWDLMRGRHVYTTDLKAVAERIRFTPDGQHYLVQYSNHVDVYSLQTAAIVHVLRPEFRLQFFDIAETKCYIGGDEGLLAVYDLTSGKLLARRNLHEARLKSIRVCQLGSAVGLLTVCSEGKLRLWSLPEKHKLDGSDMSMLAEICIKFRPVCMCVRSSLSNRQHEEVKSEEGAETAELSDDLDQAEIPHSRPKPKYKTKQKEKARKRKAETPQPTTEVTAKIKSKKVKIAKGAVEKTKVEADDSSKQSKISAPTPSKAKSPKRKRKKSKQQRTKALV